ncbi:MAG TPA: dTMP kinase [Terracidiphilus sp.]|nr:dTMP kinase [Terracidiphilus sp.]
MPRGLFITFEGLDGSGKTTQINRLAAWLKKRGHSTIITRQPGGTTTGERIRALVLDSRSKGLAPLCEMALMFADRAQTIAEVIKPALAAGKIVLCDRFTDSTEAYQGGGRELGSEVVLELHRVICSNLKPDLTFLLLPSLGPALARARRRNLRTAKKNKGDENRFEQEQDAFYRRVREKYLKIAAREHARVVLIEGDHSIKEVHEQIVAAVAERLAKLAAVTPK